MEVYLNSIEMGKGIYGAQAAAKYKFNTTAAKLSKGQCALIAATLPNPIRFNSAKPSAYILKRQKQILRLMNLVPKFPPEGKAAKKEIKKKKNKGATEVYFVAPFALSISLFECIIPIYTKSFNSCCKRCRVKICGSSQFPKEGPICLQSHGI